MATTHHWCLSSRAIVDLLQICIDSWDGGSVQVRTASQATASQALRAFSTYLGK